MMVGEGAERLALEDPPLQLVTKFNIMLIMLVRMVMMKSIEKGEIKIFKFKTLLHIQL